MSLPRARTKPTPGSHSRVRAVAISIAIIVVAYVAADAGYRFRLYRDLIRNPDTYTGYRFSSTEAPLYVLDATSGYSYVESVRLHFRLYDASNKVVRESTLHSNNYGHFSMEDDVLEKPEGEFRVAVLGDSFSATPTSDISWPDELQRQLNRDAALRKEIGKTSFKVINFGMDGTGFEQWPVVLESKVKPFHPDLVIVNFIWHDLFRRFMFRRTIAIGGNRAVISCASLPAALDNKDCRNAYSFVIDPAVSNKPESLVQMKRELLRAQMSRLPWFSPAPELLRKILKGRFGQPQLRIEPASLPLFSSPEEGLAAGERSLQDIARKEPALMVLYHPTYEECLDGQITPIGAQFIGREHAMKVENMLPHLPLSDGRDEIQKWYNLPYDSHPSNYGARIYASAVERRVARYIESMSSE